MTIDKPARAKADNAETFKPSLNYAHLITTRPHDITQVFISDLHLSADEPALVQAFSYMLDDVMALPNLRQFYILGDWFDVWVGDDAYLNLSDTARQQHWLTPVITQLNRLHQNGCQIFVMHGNRDFMIGQAFCGSFGGELIFEPYCIAIGNQQLRLEHGDALCTDDKSYQRFRRLIRNPIMQWLLLKRPLKKRLELAHTIKQKSKVDKAQKSLTIMDVNSQAVDKAVQKVNALLHGHTHRPAKHLLDNNKKRYVLGDWRVLNSRRMHAGHTSNRVEAVIGITTTDTHHKHQSEHFNLVHFEY